MFCQSGDLLAIRAILRCDVAFQCAVTDGRRSGGLALLRADLTGEMLLLRRERSIKITELALETGVELGELLRARRVDLREHRGALGDHRWRSLRHQRRAVPETEHIRRVIDVGELLASEVIELGEGEVRLVRQPAHGVLERIDREVTQTAGRRTQRGAE